jgi:predicted lactoylglutathione lyase
VFHRVTIHASDRAASEPFYDTVLATLGIAKTRSDERRAEWGDFALAESDADNPVTRRLHIGFVAPSRAEVDDFWRTGTAAGYPDDGAPGPRPQYSEDYYGAFLLDPDGNSAEGVHHGDLRRDGVVDHLWIRVADVAASKRFYEKIAPNAGFRLATDIPERGSFAGESGSFSVLSGATTDNLHMAFAGSEDAGPLSDPDGNAVEVVSRA